MLQSIQGYTVPANVGKLSRLVQVRFIGSNLTVWALGWNILSLYSDTELFSPYVGRLLECVELYVLFPAFETPPHFSNGREKRQRPFSCYGRRKQCKFRKFAYIVNFLVVLMRRIKYIRPKVPRKNKLITYLMWK